MVNKHFQLTEPAIISFSGGRTSGYMLHRFLDAQGGTLPGKVCVCFANTGRELPETLDFVNEVATRWAVPIVWLEYVAKGKYNVVDYATADREGRAFASLVRDKGKKDNDGNQSTLYLPNGVQRFCTEILKVKAFDWYMESLGHKPGDWQNIVGIRADEPRRVAKLRERTAHGENIVLPLADAGVTRAEVMAFWEAQSAIHGFDLRLQPWESNCDLCFLKGRKIRERILRDRPETGQWWQDQEMAASARFDKTISVAKLRFFANLPLLPGTTDEGLNDEDSQRVPCLCHD